MLKRFLSNLKSLPEKLQKKTPQQPQQTLQEEKSPQSQSPNLLTDTSYLKNTPLEANLQKFKSVGFLQRAILVMDALFFVLLLINVVADSQMKQVASEVRVLEKGLLAYRNIEGETKAFVDKVAVYKRMESQRIKVGENLKFVIDKARNLAAIDRLVLRERNMVLIEAIAPTPINFSLLINNYFENKNIKQIVLESATLRGRSTDYMVSLILEMQ